MVPPSILIISILFPIFAAEPMLYMFPSNPELHPEGMYPNHQFSRGKVRDLPDSGVIYLDRIKPIDQEFQAVANPEPAPSTSRPAPPPSSFERYSSEEERAPATARPTTPTPATTRVPLPVEQPNEIHFVSLTKDQKISEQKKAVQKTKLSIPEEAELDILLDDLMKNDGKSKKTSHLPKIGRSANFKRHIGAVKPKLISFDGTARVEPERRAPVQFRPVFQFGTPIMNNFKSRSSPVTVRLKPRKLYATGTAAKYQGPDFDPWERMGQ